MRRSCCHFFAFLPLQSTYLATEYCDLDHQRACVSEERRDEEGKPLQGRLEWGKGKWDFLAFLCLPLFFLLQPHPESLSGILILSKSNRGIKVGKGGQKKRLKAKRGRKEETGIFLPFAALSWRCSAPSLSGISRLVVLPESKNRQIAGVGGKRGELRARFEEK